MTTSPTILFEHHGPDSVLQLREEEKHGRGWVTYGHLLVEVQQNGKEVVLVPWIGISEARRLLTWLERLRGAVPCTLAAEIPPRKSLEHPDLIPLEELEADEQK